MPACPPLLVNLPTAGETVAFRKVMEILRTSPYLDAGAIPPNGLNIRTYEDGPDESREEKPQPDRPDLPYLRIEVGECATHRETEQSFYVEFTLALTIFVADMSQDDLLNLWGAIRLALLPTDPAEKARVRQIAASPYLVAPRFNRTFGRLSPVGKGQHGLVGVGSFAVGLLIPTG